MIYFGVMKMTSQLKYMYLLSLLIDYSFFDAINVFNALTQVPLAIKIMIF
jgi:hypothetical protein